MGPLDAQQRARDVVLLAVDQLRRRPHLPEPPSAAHDRLVERVDLLVDRACEAARPAEEGERDEAEDCAPIPPVRMRGTSTWPPMRRGEGRGVPREEVVREPARPHQRVGVEVDRRVDVEERARVRRAVLGHGSFAFRLPSFARMTRRFRRRGRAA